MKKLFACRLLPRISLPAETLFFDREWPNLAGIDAFLFIMA